MTKLDRSQSSTKLYSIQNVSSGRLYSWLYNRLYNKLQCIDGLQGPVCTIDVKKRLLSFYFVSAFTFFNVFFYFRNVFYLKNVGKVQSGKQIRKKHFQNNSNEIDL